MLNGYKILTVTHKSSSLNDLGNFVVKSADEEELKQKLSSLKEQFDLQELMYLSTCNRVMYFLDTPQALDQEFVNQFLLSANPELSHHLDQLETALSLYTNKEALEHLYGVAASIDSLVVGEREILRQLREAYDQCRKWGLTGDNIRLAMQHAVQAAKEVYAKTRIGEKPISVVSLAIQKILQANLAKDARLLLVGAGQTNNLVAKFLKKHGFHNVTVFNRSYEKAVQLAKKLAGKALRLDELNAYSEGFDCMIVCTGATQAIITPTIYTQLLAGESDQKLVIDLAVPNNVAREVVQDFDLNYVEMEDLRTLAKENLSFRKREVGIVKEMLNAHLEEFHLHYKQRQIEKAMQAVPSEIKAIKSHAMNEVFKKELEGLDHKSRDLLERMMDYMERRCISIPMKAAKDSIK